MVRTQIQLPEEDFKRLNSLAHGLNRSMADCIREAITAFLRRQPQDDLSEIIGKFSPVQNKKDKSLDGRWAEAILDSKRERVQ